MIKPPHLAEGDTIGVISPASPIASECPRRFERGVAHLQQMGFAVRVARHARASHGHTAGTIEQRVDDVHSLFSDPRVKAVLTSVGGLNSNQLLDSLDYDLIARNPKILMGYSDVTALLVAVQRVTGLVTFLGPAVLPQFGEPGGLHRYTEQWFRRVLMHPEAPLELTPSRRSIHEPVRWDVDDTAPRRGTAHRGPRTLVPGSVEGAVVAGNLSTLLVLAGSRYWPDVDGAILCVEEDESESPASVDRMVTQLRTMGVFRRIAALLVGRFHPGAGFCRAEPLKDVLLTATRGYRLPIAVDFDFGHTDPMFILPNGIRARVELGDVPRLELLEPAVEGRESKEELTDGRDGSVPQVAQVGPLDGVGGHEHRPA